MSVDVVPLTVRVNLKRRHVVEDGVVEWISAATVWAKVRPVTLPLDDKTTHGVVVRFRTDLAPEDIITYCGQVLQILTTDDLTGRRTYLRCLCRELSEMPTDSGRRALTSGAPGNE